MSTTTKASSEITRAAERYLEQYGDPLVMNTYLKVTILCLVAVCLALVALTFKSQKALANMHPMIVRINDVGRAEAIDYRNFQYRPQEAENKYYLTRWAELYFSRNRFTIERDQTNALYFLNDDVQRAVIGQEQKDNRDRLLAFIEKQGIELVFSERIAPALGMSYGGRIAVLPGQSKAEEFSTLVHELAHEMLHKAERRTATTKVVRETEAESIAFVVGKAIGLKAGTASADYIHLYHGNASLLAESLEVIQQASAVILAALESPFKKTATEASEQPEALAIAS